jgi:type II secretory pathway pseudopilin PulG
MTLVELLVTIAIVTVVTTAITGLIQSFYKDNAYLVEQTAALASARKGINQAITDVRESSYGDDGSYLITTAGTSTLVLYSDIDQDSYVERVKYSLIDGTLYRTTAQAAGSPPSYAGATQSTSTVATDVRNTDSTPLFTYYDDSGAQLSTTSPNIASVTSIQIQLLVDLNPARAPNVFTLTEKATMRNLSKQ